MPLFCQARFIRFSVSALHSSWGYDNLLGILEGRHLLPSQLVTFPRLINDACVQAVSSKLSAKCLSKSKSLSKHASF